MNCFFDSCAVASSLKKMWSYVKDKVEHKLDGIVYAEWASRSIFVYGDILASTESEEKQIV